MTPHENIPVAMLLALMPDTEPKTFCSATKRGTNGYVVAECSFHPGHVNDHRDVHTGITWV